MSIREAAEEKNDVNLFTQTTYDLWDADKIQGCVCDEGYSGFDCSERLCMIGHATYDVVASQEVQIIDCVCQTTCSGSFYLEYKNSHTKIMHDFTASDIVEALQMLPSIRLVDVSFINGASVCDNDGVSTKITFRSMPGDLPDIIVSKNALISSGTVPTVNIRTSGTTGDQGGTSADGTGEALRECSGKGYCHLSTGTCYCLTSLASTGGAFESSDGEGGTGVYHDCGYASTVPIGCPYGDYEGVNTECSGRGTCSGASTYECSCDSGYTGYACQYQSCPYGLAWFSEATASDTAHPSMECSNRGTCDRDTGICACGDGFDGDACERTVCPGEEDTICNGHGTCFSMKNIAYLSVSELGYLRGVIYGMSASLNTWDFEQSYGCYCDAGYFHGPFAYDFSDFSGSYDCSLLTCPYGDNPATLNQVNEVHEINCIATAGAFTVTFRQVTTQDIAFDADVETFRAALNLLSSIHQVEVTFSGASTVCSAGGGTTITLAYNIPGDLPLPSVDTTELTGATVTVHEVIQGTTEFVECSGQGTCDRTTGECLCYSGYTSSDGSGDGETYGSRGDCGALSKYALSTDLLGEEEEL